MRPPLVTGRVVQLFEIGLIELSWLIEFLD